MRNQKTDEPATQLTIRFDDRGLIVNGARVMDAKGEREMKLVAWEDRKIMLGKAKDSAKWRAVTTIDGKEAYLTRLFIQTDESGLTPSVVYVDLFGETVDGNDPIQEHVVKE